MADAPHTHTALITGAGSGIGRAVAESLAQDGWHVALIGRREQALRETADAARSRHPHGLDPLVIPADLTDPQAINALVETVRAAWPHIGAVINNAGSAQLAPIEETDEALIERTFAVNTFAPLLLIARLWLQFREQGGATVINVSSMSTVDPFPGLSVYAAAKAAVESQTRSIMNEGGEFGMRAFSVAPGAVETPMLRGLFSDADLPDDRTLQPEQVADVIHACLRGERESDLGGTILIPSP